MLMIMPLILMVENILIAVEGIDAFINKENLDGMIKRIFNSKGTTLDL